jgi:hypothetical protein
MLTWHNFFKAGLCLRVNSFVLSELVGRVEPLLAELTLEGSDLKVATPVITQQRSLRELLAALQTLIRLLFVVARPG